VLDGLLQWSSFDAQKRCGLVAQLQARLATLGPPREHPFWGSRKTVALPSETERLGPLVQEAAAATASLRDAGARLAESLGFESPASPRECDRHVQAADWLVAKISLPGCRLGAAEWTARRAEVEAILDAIEAFRRLAQEPSHRGVWPMAWEFGHDPDGLRALWDGVQASIRRGVLPEAGGVWPESRHYGHDTTRLLALRADLQQHGHPWWRCFTPAFWRTRSALRVYFMGGRLPRGLDAQLAVIDAVLAAQKQLAILEQHRELASRLLGGCGLFDARCDWGWIEVHVRPLRELHAEIDAGRVPAGVFDVLSAPAPPEARALTALAGAARDARSVHRGVWSRLGEPLEFDANLRYGPDGLDTASFVDQQATLSLWSNRGGDLAGLAAWNAAALRARGEGLGTVVDLAESWAEAPRELLRAFRSS
jgi:hypothetical protein